MKRDLDLCRQLLADLESHGPDCAVTALRPGVTGEADEQVRYHVRLLIDAGLAKEVDRTTGGVPCVRLTDAGHELLELAASEARWREAKWVVGERTGGQSLTVIRAVLARWAHEAAVYGERWRPRRAAYRPYPYAAYRRPYAAPRVEPRYRFERDVETPTRFKGDRDAYGAYLERFDWRWPVDWRDAADRDAWYRDAYYRDAPYRDAAPESRVYADPAYADPNYGAPPRGEYEPGRLDGVTLPTHVV